MSNRYIVEGEWSGYKSSQQRIVHREVITSKRADRLKQISAIQYTDGTTLRISIRPCLPREKVKEILGYTTLISQALSYSEKHNKSFVTVMELNGL